MFHHFQIDEQTEKIIGNQKINLKKNEIRFFFVKFECLVLKTLQSTLAMIISESNSQSYKIKMHVF